MTSPVRLVEEAGANSSPRTRKADAACLLVLFALCLVFFWRALFCGADRIIDGWDILGTYYPYKFFIKEALLHGKLPLWNPYYYCGYPFIANSWAAAYYPLDIIFLFLPMARAFNISLFVHVFLAGAFMYLWMRQFEPPVPSITAAIVFMFSGFFIARLPAGHFGMIRTGVYLPFIFFCYEKAIRENWKWIFPGGIAVGLMLLIGHPQIAYYELAFLGLYAICRTFFGPALSSEKRFPKALLVFACMTIAGVAVAAVNIVPVIEMTFLSVRSQSSPDYVGIGSLDPLQMIRLFFPRLEVFAPGVTHLPYSWEWNFYIGIFPLFLTMIALKNYRRRPALLFAGLAVAALVVAFGEYSPVFPLLYHAAPFFAKFRLHSRALLVFIFFAATLAGMGMGAIVGKAKPNGLLSRRLVLIWTAILCIVLLFVIFNLNVLFEFFYENEPLDSALIVPLLFMLLSCAAAWIIISGKLSTKQTTALILALIVSDLFVAGWGHLRTRSLSEYVESSFGKKAEIKFSPPGQSRIFLHDSVFPPNLGMVLHLESLNGSTPIMLGRTVKFMEAMSGIVPFRNPYNYTINQKYFQDFDFSPFTLLNVRYAMEYEEGFVEARIVENPKPFPRAVWIQDAQVLPGPDAVLKELASDDFDPYHSVLLEEPDRLPVSSQTEQFGWIPARIDDYQINALKVTVDAPSDGWLLLSEHYYPGWKAWCDEVPAPVLQADYLLRAVRIPAGRHTVRMEFCPLSFLIGAGVSLSSAVTLLAAIAIIWFRKGGTTPDKKTFG